MERQAVQMNSEAETTEETKAGRDPAEYEMGAGLQSRQDSAFDVAAF